jgi:uncharacterized membrane protein YjgN (DUF898 family)
MFFRRNKAVCSSLLFVLFTAGTKHLVGSVFSGIGRTILFVLIASLLLFLIVRSGDIYSRLAASLKTLRFSLFEPPDASITARQPRHSLTLPRTPRLPMRFQLPPPISI